MIPEKGSTVFVRTLTDHWVGRVADADTLFVRLEQASWVADSGRLGEFCRTGRSQNMEIEVVGKITVRYEAVIDWPHELFAGDE